MLLYRISVSSMIGREGMFSLCSFTANYVRLVPSSNNISNWLLDAVLLHMLSVVFCGCTFSTWFHHLCFFTDWFHVLIIHVALLVLGCYDAKANALFVYACLLHQVCLPNLLVHLLALKYGNNAKLTHLYTSLALYFFAIFTQTWSNSSRLTKWYFEASSSCNYLSNTDETLFAIKK